MDATMEANGRSDHARDRRIVGRRHNEVDPTSRPPLRHSASTMSTIAPDGAPVAGSVGPPGGGASDALDTTGVTATDSEASLHTPETETLLASPLYVAIQR